MVLDLPESDWRKLRALHPIALNRFSQRILAEGAAIIADQTMTHHQRYLALFRHMRERDRDVADAFNDMRRSRATIRIAFMRRLDVITDEEFSSFSEETQNAVCTMRGISREG